MINVSREALCKNSRVREIKVRASLNALALKDKRNLSVYVFR